MPLLSIVVPYYNVDRYIGECLESLRLQTLSDVEVILVDDGSLDGSRNRAQEYVDRDSRFRIVTQENQGLGPARNTGVRHAEGEFLTFIDSDDVVSLHAYERLVTQLQDTGSDFVSCGAGRFSSLGVSPSMVQTLVCSTTRPATHISRDPILGLDRMAWNKLYRRSFFEESGLSFPAMLLEDFPVSIRAHTSARAVDTVADVLYFWRVRDGGEPSITQRSAEIGNVGDRLTSALDVLGVVETEAPDSLPAVRQHLLEVDVQAMVAAITVNAEPERVKLLAMAQELNARVGPDAGNKSIAFYKVQAALLEQGDLEGLLELHGHLRLHGKKAGLRRRGRLRKKYYEDLPLLGTGRVPDAAYEPSKQPQLAVTVDDLAWSEGVLDLDLVLSAGIELGEESTLEVWWESESGRRIPVEATRHTRLHPLVGHDLTGARVSLDPESLAENGKLPGGFWTLYVGLRSKNLSAVVPVADPSHGRGRFPPTLFHGTRAGLQVQPYRRDVGFGVRLRRPVASIEAASAEGGSLVLGGWARTPEPGEEIGLIVRSRSGEEHRFDTEVSSRPDDARLLDWRAVVPGDGLLGRTDYSDPIHAQRLFAARLTINGNERPMALGRDFCGATVVTGTRALTATRNIASTLEIVESPVSPEITSVGWQGESVLRFEGTWGGSPPLPGHVLLEHFPEPGNGIGHEVPLTVEGTAYTYDVDVRDLVAAMEGLSGIDPTGRVEPWHLLLRIDGRLRTQTGSREQLSSFAAPRLLGDRRVSLLHVRNDVVRLEVALA